MDTEIQIGPTGRNLLPLSVVSAPDPFGSLTELRMDTGQDGWGHLSVGSRLGTAVVLVSEVIDVVGQIVGAADDVLRWARERRLEWDVESLAAGVITIARLSDDQVGLSLSWRSRKAGRDADIAFEVATVQLGMVLAERVLEMADSIGPGAYATEWSCSWPAESIDSLRRWR